MEAPDNPAPIAGTRAWYGASIGDFLDTELNAILGRLTVQNEFALLPTQTAAWLEEIHILRSSVQGLQGSLFLEFTIPRMGRRIDAVLLIGPVVFAIEFKVGERTFDRAALDQVWDYALDLKNFHEASHEVAIVPILVASEGQVVTLNSLKSDKDKVYRPVSTNPECLRQVIDMALATITGANLNEQQWPTAPYHPTPTIVEAARALYSQHSVEAIARFDAGAKNLRVTSRRIDELVDEAMAQRRKIICFVTGVPGAGKTLVGLNVATRHRREDQPTHAVYLSGNGPLVDVLREALTRDEVSRNKTKGKKVRKGIVFESIKSFIQNVHHFRDEAIIDTDKPPIEHVVIFDEAQRAWNLRKTANFMQRRKGRPGFSQSEPEFLISYMDRHKDWAAVICLVGGGQEINDGEAGIDAWLDAVNTSFPNWHTYISSRLVDSEYAAGQALVNLRHRNDSHMDDSLHLAVSMRSFRAENVSEFVKALLDGNKHKAQTSIRELVARYPMAVTRDLSLAKQWVRSHARGTERFGMMASSKAQRLKPHAIDIRIAVNPIHWFLSDGKDTRSSFYLEDAATEFQVQGLEIDWACVTWDGDLRSTGSGWSYHDFRGDKWTKISKAENQNYLRNAYRVLLTRARQGMIVFVPKGDSMDPTRRPDYYDCTFNYLADLGVPVLA